MSLNMNDAAVALRSFGRRYGEVVNGPVGDDAWERKVRAVQPKSHSALAYVAHAAASIDALAVALIALPKTKEPVLSLPAIGEPTNDATASSLVQQVKTAGANAAAALDARSHDDYDRTVLVGSKTVEVRAAVADVVATCVNGLKLAEQAIETA
jgi:hypothetical protein